MSLNYMLSFLNSLKPPSTYSYLKKKRMKKSFRLFKTFSLLTSVLLSVNYKKNVKPTSLENFCKGWLLKIFSLSWIRPFVYTLLYKYYKNTTKRYIKKTVIKILKIRIYLIFPLHSLFIFESRFKRKSKLFELSFVRSNECFDWFYILK